MADKPYVDPRLSQQFQPALSPSAARYQEELRKRQQDLPKGEVPLPPIPNLGGQPPMTGQPMSMAAAAMLERGGGVRSSILQGSQAPKIQPNDLLPDEAMQDPAFLGGIGSKMAMHQPSLALKYGVVRDGQPIPPSALQPPPPAQRLRPETLEGLKQLEIFNQAAQKAQNPDAVVEQQAAAGSAGVATRLANGDDSVKPSTPDDRKRLDDALKGMDDFDFHTFRQMMMRDLINNEEQRKIIEERLQPLDITTLIMEGTLTQIVPIIPGKFEPEFEMVSGDVDLGLKALIAKEAKSLDVSDQYYLDKFAMMALTAGLRAINKIPMPPCRDERGDFSEEKFLDRFKRVVRLPLPMLASLAVNYFWYDVRTRKLFVAERVKNG